MDGGTDGGGELKECKNMQQERREKTVKMRGRGVERGMSGISEWDESGWRREWRKNGKMWDNDGLPELIYLHSEKKTPYIAALAGTAEGGSHVLHRPLSLICFPTYGCDF